MKLTRTEYKNSVYNILKSSDTSHPTWTSIDYFQRLSRPLTKLYLINDKQGIIFLHISNELGCYIKPEFQGKGLAGKALAELIFQNPRQYYWATVRNDNLESREFLKKIGFTPDGIVYGLDKTNE